MSGAVPSPNPGSQSQLLGDSLQEYLRRASAAIQATEFSQRVLRGAIAGLLTLMVLILIDHWVWPLPIAARLIAFLMLSTGFLWWLLRRILPLAFRRIHPEYAARQIEQSMPELKNSLINWLQLSKDGTPPPKGILATVARYAAGRLRGHEAQSVVDASTPIKLAAILFGALVVFGIYLAIAPKSGLDTMRRLLFPLADIQAPTRVRILQVEPGDSKVTQGSVLEIKAQVRGLQAIDTVEVRYETTDGQLVDQKIPMEAETEGLFYRLRLGSGSNGIHQDLRYWVEAGDAVAGPYSVTIQPIPLVAIDRVEYVYPAYTRLAPRIVPGDGRIEAIEGTRVTIHGRSNQPLQKARVEIDPVMEQGEFVRASTIYDVRIEDVGLVCDWLLQLDPQRVSPTVSSYRIKATNPLGESNLNPVIYPIKVLGDIPPEAIWRIDSRKPIQLPVNQTMELPLRATDPDFGLQKLAIVGKVGQRLRIEKTLLESAEPLVGPQEQTWQLKPQEWQLKAGERLELSMIATDHRTKPGTDEPQPNVGQSLPLVIEIVGPNESASKTPEDQKRSGDSDSANPNGDPTKDQKEDPSGKQGAKDPRKPAAEKGTQKPEDRGAGSDEPMDRSTEENPGNQTKESLPNPPGKEKGEKPEGKEQKEQEKSSQSEGASGGGAGGQDSSDSSSDRSDSSEGSADQPGGSGKSSKPSKGQGDPGDSQQDPGDASEEGSEGGGQMADGQSPGNRKSASGQQATNGSSSDNQNGDDQGTQSGTQSQGGDRSGGNRSGSSGNEQNGSPDSASSEGESSDNAPPEHDGEVFERIQKYLQERGKSSTGDSAQPKGDENENPSGSADPSQAAGESAADPKEGADPGTNGQPDRQGNRSPGKGPGQSSKTQGGDRADQVPDTDSSSPSMPQDASPGDTKEINEPGKTDQVGEKQGNSSGNGDTNQPSQSKSGNRSQSAEKESPDSSATGEDGMNEGTSEPTGSPDQPSSEQSGAENRSSKSASGNQKGDANGSKSTEGEASSGSEGSEQGSDGSSDGSKGSSDGSKGSSDGSKGSSDGSKGPSDGSKGEQEGAGESGGESNGSQGAKEGGAQKGSSGASSKSGRSEGSADGTSSGGPSSSKDPSSAKPNPSPSDDRSDEKSEGGKSGQRAEKSTESSGSGDSPSGQQAASEGSQEAAGASGAKGGDGTTGGGPKTGPAGSSASGRSRGNASGQGAPGTADAAGGPRDQGEGLDGQQAENLADPANLEYAKKATDLALEALRRQREQPDPELLKKLHWSEQDLRKFLDRWESAREQAMSDPQQQRKFEKELQALGLVPRRGDARQVDRRLDQLRGMRESGVRMPAPENLRRQFDQYRRSLSNPPPSSGK